MNGCVIGNRWAGFAGVTSFAQSANSKSPKTEEVEKVIRRRMTQVWTLMIDNRTQSFCQFVLPGISLCQQKQQKKSFWPDSLVLVLPFPNNCQQLKILLPYKRLLTKCTVRHLQLHHSNSRHSPLASYHRQHDQMLKVAPLLRQMKTIIQMTTRLNATWNLRLPKAG